MLYNSEAVNTEFTTESFAPLSILENLPDYDSYWELTEATSASDYSAYYS
jgi:hypothetical protein